MEMPHSTSNRKPDMSRHRFSMTLGKEALNVKLVMVERIDCTSTIRPTGSGWVLTLPQLEVEADQDVDVFAFVEGLPGTQCEMTVTIDEGDEDSFSREFNRNGNASFAEQIKVEAQ